MCKKLVLAGSNRLPSKGNRYLRLADAERQLAESSFFSESEAFMPLWLHFARIVLCYATKIYSSVEINHVH
jgi:hypothetical protein